MSTLLRLKHIQALIKRLLPEELVARHLVVRLLLNGAGHASTRLAPKNARPEFPLQVAA
jgi:hypothetical protein